MSNPLFGVGFSCCYWGASYIT